jgi:NHLM bacteriocin system ABC transporter ATP-binding protein
MSRLPLAADRPLPLEAIVGCWVVAAGHVDLFAQRRGGGRREFLLRLPAGASLCGSQPLPQEPAVTVLAVGGLDSELAGAADPALAAEHWVTAVDELMRDPARGWTERHASPGETVLARGALLGIVGRQVLWASVLEGAVTGPSGEPAVAGVPVPLTAACPLLALADSALVLRHTAELSAQELMAALGGHRAALLHHAERLIATREAERAGRQARSAAAEAGAMAAGLAGLAGRETGERGEDLGADPAWRVVARAAAALGQPLPEPPAGVDPALPSAERVAAFATLAGLRLRPVLLKGDWWQHDNGPLVALRQADQSPVTLLPSAQGYRVIDPALPRPHRLGMAEAEGLAPLAWMPYRSFPPTTLALGRLLGFALRGLRPERWRLVVVSVLAALLGLAGPVGLGLLVAYVIPASDQEGLWLLGAGLAAAALGAAGLELTRGLLLHRIEARFALETQAALFDRVLRLPVAFFRRFGAGDLADRVLALEQVRRGLSGAGLGMVLGGALALANLAVMLWCSPLLALVGVAMAALACGVSTWLCMRQLQREHALAERRGRAETFVLEAMAGVGKLKVAGALDRAFAVWARLYGRQRAAFTAAQALRDAQGVVAAGLVPLATAVLFMAAAAEAEALRTAAAQAAGWAAANGQPGAPPRLFGLPSWLAFAAAFGQLMAGGAQAVQAVSRALAVVPLYARARPLLQTPPETRRDAHAPGPLSGAVELNRVTFGYSAGAAPVLQELSFSVAPGEYVALVGPSGSGKSTILRLLLGFEQPGAGTVLYDGRPLSSLDPAAVRRQVGVVLQHGRLRQGSILENIGGGHPIGLEEAWAAARLAGFAEEIRALPMGMHTVVPEAGGTLSGGQRQRLMIARALARRPRLLLLDEATSALDNRTQAVVTESLAGLALTRIVVAHRLSTIGQVDRVLVLNRGRLVQSGSFRELLDQPGLFQELARRQLA